ncbi:nucleotide exchange factor SIL1-like protein [Blastocystis sp. subtype 4]|uniref:nucleotide exchange factor SIL1-like protein n=1 Tax=Blastocystis sp. subtype 4 TaxID=944170 RepID=UPI000712266F|nr:nucleotide exchange factor SIL1-like protein [Blastocystis sp. subtype 4]KNB42019.1 nucleotide exchange factor SIL1-like protein [Blastocystis sp. subtype 4]|eukprot:XP_014525462.1 nucleotide exchange factor SIL1-like protein [Blastocystis sp. subtype 4]
MILWNSIDDEDEDEKSDHRSSSDSVPPFIPTHEWQEVKEGQSIPPGLSIRFDFETGKNYAKLLDEDPKKESSSTYI